MSEFGMDRARELAAESHGMAREALAEVGARPAPGALVPEGAASRSNIGSATDRAAAVVDSAPNPTAELEGITDFIYTRTS